MSSVRCWVIQSLIVQLLHNFLSRRFPWFKNVGQIKRHVQQYYYLSATPTANDFPLAHIDNGAFVAEPLEASLVLH